MCESPEGSCNYSIVWCQRGPRAERERGSLELRQQAVRLQCWQLAVYCFSTIFAKDGPRGLRSSPRGIIDKHVPSQ